MVLPTLHDYSGTFQGGSLREQEGLYTLRKQPRENTDRMQTSDCVSRSAVRPGHHVMHLFLCQSQLGEAEEEWAYLSPPLYVHVRMPLFSLCSSSVAYVRTYIEYYTHEDPFLHSPQR